MGKLYSLISALLLTVSATFAAAPDSYEWWFDQDVSSMQTGYVSGSTIDLEIDTSDLPKGIHYFNLRLAEGDSIYGSVYRKMFHSFGADESPISYEYWYDFDYDSKQTGALNVGSNHLDLDISSLPEGAHYFNIRLGYGDGSWGSVYRKMVLNLAGDVNTVAYEYWIDNNYEAKTSGRLAEGANAYEIDMQGVRKGLHRFNYRLQTGEGVWGAPFTQYFYCVSNASRFTEYEYWLDKDYENRVSANVSTNPVSFEVDLSNFDKSGGAHYFNLRTRDGDGEWSTVYRKLLLFNSGDQKVPMVGYRQYLNGAEFGYVEVERKLVDSYLFDVNLPDSIYPSLRNRIPVFQGDTVSIAGTDTVNYTMQIRTELGWDSPKEWKFDVSNDFSTKALAMEVNSLHTFASPKALEFAAVKFNSVGDTLFFRSDVPVGLDIYKEGARVHRLSPDSIGNMARLLLESGEYYGLLYEVRDTLAQNFTFHIMSTPNLVPDPEIAFEEGTVTISCVRSDAEIRYSLDGSDPDEESTLYSVAFPLKRNATVKAVATVPGSDIIPSSIVELIVDSYKVDNPVGEFDAPSRLLTLTCETENASIAYSQDFVRNDTVSAHWTPYTDPVRIRKNGSVFAKATLDGYNDSDIVEIVIDQLPDSVAVPAITFNDGSVTITCETADSEIHYTLDGTDPTEASTLYESPFALTRNATVKALALIPDLDIDPSEMAELVVDSYKVNAPTSNFEVATRLLTLVCDTVDAAIRYTFDKEGEWLEYTEPIRLRKNCTVFAKATLDGYNDSDIVEIVIDQLPDSVAVPAITFNDGSVTITCETADSEIHYTLDGTDPTEASTLYESPFALTRNATVKALALIPDLDIDPSEMAELVVDSYKVNAPTSNFEVATRLLTLVCDTVDAAISYTFDRDGEWQAYTEPIRLRKNCTVYAKATLDGYNDSDIAEIVIDQLPDSVAAPAITFNDGSVTITCETADAEIHCTLDGTDPTADSPHYVSPFALGRNATVKAIALIPDLDINPSEIAELVVNSYKVSTPTGTFDSSTRHLTLSCATAGANISYTLDMEGAWSAYTGPISITRNCTVYARATFDGYRDSDIATIEVTVLPNRVTSPAIVFVNGTVTITCETAEAEIHYTLDGTNPTVASTLYQAPFALGHNATVKAIALIPDLDINPSEISEFVVDSYKVATPTGTFDSNARQLSLSCPAEGASILYAFDRAGEWLPYTAPVGIDGNCTVYVKATLPDFNDSDIAEIVISDLKCGGVTFRYNGRYLTMEADEPDARILYTTDGSDPSNGLQYAGELDVAGLCKVRSVAVRDRLLNSDEGVFEVDRYANDDHAVTASAGLLPSAFDWDKNVPNSVDTYRIEGRLNESDYAFIRSMKALRHLDISKVAEARIPDGAFKDTKLISLSLPENITACGDGILTDAPLLSSLIWNSKSALESSLTKGIANPNLLIYVPAGTDTGTLTGLNVVSADRAAAVTLHYAHPYYAARDFRADRVSMTREFLQQTEVGVCQGWETLVLPFAPQTITHESNGPAVPFAAWDGDTRNGPKPFWLYSSVSDGWEEAKSIEPGVPYIISMPNNKDYVEADNLAGCVTFSADNINLGPETNFALSTPWMYGTEFEGSFMPVEEDGILTLNVGDSGEYLPGSTFVTDSKAVPFSAYVVNSAGRKAMPVFGDSSSLDLPTLFGDGLLIETPAPGVLKISSSRERKVAVTTVTGVTLRILRLLPGETATVEGLTRDLYLVAGRKVFVK